MGSTTVNSTSTVDYTALLSKLRSTVSQYANNNTLSTVNATKTKAKTKATTKTTTTKTTTTKTSDAHELSQKYQYQNLYNSADEPSELSDDFAWLNETFMLAFGGNGQSSKFFKHTSKYDDLLSSSSTSSGGWRNSSFSFLYNTDMDLQTNICY